MSNLDNKKCDEIGKHSGCKDLCLHRYHICLYCRASQLHFKNGSTIDFAKDKQSFSSNKEGKKIELIELTSGPNPLLSEQEQFNKKWLYKDQEYGSIIFFEVAKKVNQIIERLNEI